MNKEGELVVSVVQDETVYMISVKDSDNMYITDYFHRTPEGIKFTECDKDVFIPYNELEDVEKRVTKRSSILKELQTI